MPPVFPQGASIGGLKLRDYFAALAMQGLVARGDYQAGMDQPRREEQWSAAAYRIADAMLLKREE